MCSVAKPEPMERQHFARAGAEVFGPAPGSEPGMKILTKCYKNPKFFLLKFEVEIKITISLLFTLQNLFIIYVFKKHENF
jgi:hypothetical protein